MARACGLAGAFAIAQDPEAAKALQPIADAVIPDYFGVRIIGGDSGNEAD